MYLLRLQVASFIEGFFSEAFTSDFILDEGKSYFTTHSQYRAQSIQIYSLNPIASFIAEESSLTSIVVSSYALSSQQASIMALYENEDQELQRIYRIAY